MTVTYDTYLVALSFLTAAAASYTALDLASRVQAAKARVSRAAWIALASLAMGGGIWAMHFIAMLSFRMSGMTISYDMGATLASFVLAVGVTAVAFALVNSVGRTWRAVGIGGLLMGVGIAGMHYTGMAAMRMAASVSYDPLWVIISIVVAIGAAMAALALSFAQTGLAFKALASLVMGLAVWGMHFSGMQAAHYTAGGDATAGHDHINIGQTDLASAVAATTFGILFLTLIASMVDRRIVQLATAEANALRKSEEQFRSLYRRTPLPLHAFDQQGRITEVSDAWLGLLGYQRDEVLGKVLADFMTTESATKRVEIDWPTLLERGELLGVEYQLLTKSGAAIDVLSSSRIERDAQSRFVAAIGGMVDVTARKRAEEALRQSQKMESIGQLTGGVAHDFNNLLAIVIGNLELLKKRHPMDDAASKLLSNALEGARRGASLTQRMLAFSRQQSLTPEALDVPNLVYGMKDLLARSMGPQISIETQFPISISKAMADANQLENALLNLVVNSRDAMPDGGTITITVRECALRQGEDQSLKAGKYVCLSVRDEGEGMDEAKLARAREPFFTTKGVTKGTGLGLSMVHGFAEQSGGALKLMSAVGIGTTAEIWLPVADNSTGTKSMLSPDSVGQTSQLKRTLTVLAVDDDALVLMNTEAMLQDLGHRVFTASSGSDALTIIAEGRDVDVVVTDQAMPRMTGLQLAAALREMRPDLPILLATGYADIPENSELRVAQLQKPFSEDQLARALSAVLR